MKIPSDIVAVNDLCTLKVDTDTVPWTDPYYVKTFLAFEDKKVDYVNLNAGELFIKTGKSFDKIVFDVSDIGELQVLAVDAENYYIDPETGELYYLFNDEPVLEGIDYMIIEDDFIVT